MRLRLLILPLLSLTFAGQAMAEPFVDVFGGWSKARATNSSASRQTCFILGCTGTAGTTQHQSFSSGAAVGVRGGYWFKTHPWFGLAGDFTYYRTASAQVSLDSFALAATPMLRLPPLDRAGSASGSPATLRRSGADTRHAQCESELSADRAGGGQRLVDGSRLDSSRGAGRLDNGACGGVRRMAPVTGPRGVAGHGIPRRGRSGTARYDSDRAAIHLRPVLPVLNRTGLGPVLSLEHDDPHRTGRNASRG